MRALATAATGMQAQQMAVDVISNNIANANTTAFKSSRMAFTDLVYQSLRREGAATSDAGTTTPIGLDIGLGVRGAGTARLQTQGGLLQTEDDLDVAIDGGGYFVVTAPDGGQVYTRDGAFELSAEGEIVTKFGHPVEPGIVVPERTQAIEIGEDGAVLAYLEDDPEPVEVGRLTMATFVNEGGLRPVGNNLFEATSTSGDAIQGAPGEPGFGTLRQGYLENSNVDVIQQLTGLIKAQRAYELNSKTIEAADQMMSTATRTR